MRTALRLRWLELDGRAHLLVGAAGPDRDEVWGEAAPLPGYSPDTAQEAWSSLQRIANDRTGNTQFRSQFGVSGAGSLALPPSAAFALETALDPPPAITFAAPPISALLPAGPAAQVVEAARAAWDRGRRVLKLKTRGLESIPALLEVLQALRGALPATARLRLDGNGRTLGGALPALLSAVAPWGIELFEEPGPVAEVEALASSPVPLAMDESLQRPDAETLLVRWAERGLLGGVVLKPSTLGGRARCAALAERARGLGLGVSVTHCFEGPVGFAAVQAVAQAVEADVAGLEPYPLLARWPEEARPLRELRVERRCPPVSAARAEVGDGELPSPSALAAALGAEPALSAEGSTWSGTWLAAQVRRRAAALADWPVGQRLGLVAEPTVEVLLAVLAALEAGVSAALLHPRWVEAERARFLESCGARLCDPAELGRASAARRAPSPPRGPGELVLATSGTSGPPQAVRLGAAALFASAAASQARLPLARGERSLLSLPPAHVGGVGTVLRSLYAGGTLVLAPPWPRFDPRRVHAELEGQSIGRLSLVPTALMRLLELGLTAPRALRAVLLGGASLPAPLLRAAAAQGWPVHPTYGLTEACSQVTLEPAAGATAGAGPPLPGVELRLGADEEILVRGPLLAQGSVGGSALLDPEGWLHTGDLGRLDAQGTLHVQGRRSERIISGGENVHPAEVEAVLLGVEGVQAACVLGLPDERWGERVEAVLVARQPPVPEARVRAELERALSDFKRPKRLHWWAALPETAGGKLDRRAVAALLAAG